MMEIIVDARLLDGDPASIVQWLNHKTLTHASLIVVQHETEYTYVKERYFEGRAGTTHPGIFSLDGYREDLKGLIQGEDTTNMHNET